MSDMFLVCSWVGGSTRLHSFVGWYTSTKWSLSAGFSRPTFRPRRRRRPPAYIVVVTITARNGTVGLLEDENGSRETGQATNGFPGQGQVGKNSRPV